jgi:hypothetical protein
MLDIDSAAEKSQTITHRRQRDFHALLSSVAHDRNAIVGELHMQDIFIDPDLQSRNFNRAALERQRECFFCNAKLSN